MSSPLEKQFENITKLQEFQASQKAKSLPKVEINPFTNRVFKIILFRDDPKIPIAKASAFLFKHSSTYWLITNHHNFTGVNMKSRKRIDGFGASPLKFILPIWIDGKMPCRENAIFDLYVDEIPNWFIHPEHSYNIDVVAIPLNFRNYQQPKAINDPGMLTAIRKPQVTDDVFVVGYPGIDEGSSVESLPIWKRASIAFEPDLNSGGLPRAFVDTASRPGMSGSPVLLKCQETVNNAGLYDYSLFGVYSGRLGSGTALDSQLGIVWKTSVIKEIICGNKKDDLFYPSESFPNAEEDN